MAFILSCSATANSVGESNMKTKQSIQRTRPAQIIIKFKDNVPDPSRHEFVQEISSVAKVNLHYLRPMSGGAHVFRVENGGKSAQIGDIIKRLSKRPDIIYVEPDAIMTHQLYEK